MTKRYLEDFAVGQIFGSGRVRSPAPPPGISAIEIPRSNRMQSPRRAL